MSRGMPAHGATRGLYAARALLAANAVVWLVLAVMTVARPWVSRAAAEGAPPLLVLLMLGNAAALLGLSRRLRPESVKSLVVAAGWVTANLILSFTDQVGVMDVSVALLNAVTLVAIASLRRRV